MKFTIYTPTNIYEAHSELEAVALVIHACVGELHHEALGRLADQLDEWACMDAPLMEPGDTKRFPELQISVVRD